MTINSIEDVKVDFLVSDGLDLSGNLTISAILIKELDNSSDQSNRNSDHLRKRILVSVHNTYGEVGAVGLKENKIIALYRKFYHKIVKIDPTKQRPSSEALIRRILRGKEIPKINPAVDAYNSGSIESCIPFGGYDADLFLDGTIEFDYAKEDEVFFSHSSAIPIRLDTKQLVMRANSIYGQKTVINVYPYRDSSKTTISDHTRNVLLLGLGVPGLDQNYLATSTTITANLISETAGGLIQGPKLFDFSG